MGTLTNKFFQDRERDGKLKRQVKLPADMSDSGKCFFYLPLCHISIVDSYYLYLLEKGYGNNLTEKGYGNSVSNPITTSLTFQI